MGMGAGGFGRSKESWGTAATGAATMSVRNREWMLTQLEGTGITMVGRYRGLIRGTDFRCEKGHEFTESAGVVANRKSCPLCGLELVERP